MAPTMDLDELFRHYGTDKGRADYASVYHALFMHITQQPVSLLEVGIGTLVFNAHSSMFGVGDDGYRQGASLRAWRDYFPNALIYGLDTQSDTQFTDEARITTFIGSSTDPVSVGTVLSHLQFDIVIDDASHVPSDQLLTLRHVYPYVKPGGYFIIEDLGLSSPLLTTYRDEVRAIIGHDFMFATEGHVHLMVISRRRPQ